MAKKNLTMLKSLFDYTKASGPHYQSKNLPNELFIKQMDEEQIWQQLEMQNESFWEKCMTETCRLLSLNESKLSLIKTHSIQSPNDDSVDKFHGDHDENGIENNDDSNGGTEEEDEEFHQNSDTYSDANNDNDEEAKSRKNTSSSKIASVVDDSFFKLHEMEAFLDSEDKKETNRLDGQHQDDSDDINYFESLSESESADENGEKNAMFADFFDTEDTASELANQMKQKRRTEREARNIQKERQKKEDLGVESSDDEGEIDDLENIEKSEFGTRQDRLKKRIEEYEENALADKPWQLKGEISSSTRPKNSLLEEFLEFDSVTRPPPLITEETTLCLEDIIKRRIKSKAWDDVVRKIKPITEHQDFRKNLVLQQEKSKESLAQIYEKEYLEKVQKLNNVDGDTDAAEIPAHAEIRKAMKDLFVKLDALSNFHFTSKPVAAEVKIISNIPAIEMEEVAPLAASNATLLAPEEIRPANDEIGKTERTDTDKKRERRKKKLHQKLNKKKIEQRIEEKEKLGIKATSKEKQTQLMNQVTKGRNVIKVCKLIDMAQIQSNFKAFCIVIPFYRVKIQRMLIVRL